MSFWCRYYVGRTCLVSYVGVRFPFCVSELLLFPTCLHFLRNGFSSPMAVIASSVMTLFNAPRFSLQTSTCVYRYLGLSSSQVFSYLRVITFCCSRIFHMFYSEFTLLLWVCIVYITVAGKTFPSRILIPCIPLL